VVLGLLGRTSLVLAGAFLIRVCTEGGELPRLAGVVLGLIYAVVWALAADRAGAKGRPLDAACHAIACTVIAYPLLWEATTRFAALGRWLPAGDQGWMVYPLLSVTAGKLLLQDVPQGRPLTLTLAFACFGAALWVAPR